MPTRSHGQPQQHKIRTPHFLFGLLHGGGRDPSEAFSRSPLKVQNLTRRRLEEFEAGDVLKRFFKHMDKFLLKVDQVSSAELPSFLEDAMVVEQTRFRMEHGRHVDAVSSSQDPSLARVFSCA